MYIQSYAKIKQTFAPEMLARIRAHILIDSRYTYEIISDAVDCDTLYCTSTSATEYFKFATSLNLTVAKNDTALVVETCSDVQTVYVVVSDGE